MTKKKFDESRYEISEEMPAKFAQVIPGMGIQHFSKEHLSENDIKALLKAKSQYVSKKDSGKEPAPEYVEDAPAAEQVSTKKEKVKPEYKDIGAGTFPQ